MTGPGDPAGAGRGRLRAGHADREQVIEALKAAFVDGRLTKDELAARTGRALAARTYADLAALTADLPAEPAVAEQVRAVLAPAAPAAPAAAEQVPAVAAPAIRRPMARAGAISGVCLVTATAAMKLAFYLDPVSGPPGPDPGQPWAKGFVLVALFAVMMALLAVGLGVTTSIQQRRSRRRLPGGPAPGAA
jgi:Domain of unknown function (DUF1707)